MKDNTSRRRFLALAGSATTIALAGCSSSGSGGGSGQQTSAGGQMTGGSETTDGSQMTDGSGMNDGDQSTDDEEMDDSMSGPVSMTVRIENVAPTDFYPDDSHTGGQVWITPGAYAVHMDTNPIHEPGTEASIGLEGLAEAGPPTGFPDEPGLINELSGLTGSMGVADAGAYTPEDTTADPNDPMGSVPGAPPIAPGGAFEFKLEAEEGQKLSFASMFVPSNDIYFATGTDGIPLWPMDGQPNSGDVTDHVGLYDAGTEPNGKPGFGPDQAPAQSSPDQGADEGGVVRPISDVNDGFEYPAASDAIRVILSPNMDGGMSGGDDGGGMSGDDGGSMDG
jgi:hypothetical protein